MKKVLIAMLLCCLTVVASGEKMMWPDEEGLMAETVTAEEIGEAEAYFLTELAEYVNTVAGYSLQYPADFADSFVSEDATGFAATLPDGNAEIRAERKGNQNNRDLKAFVRNLTSKDPTLTVEYDALGEKARLSGIREDGYHFSDIYIVTDEWIYHVSMAWSDKLDSTYKNYSDYVMNSLSCDELSAG